MNAIYDASNKKYVQEKVDSLRKKKKNIERRLKSSVYDMRVRQLQAFKLL